MNREFIKAIEQIEKEKGIERDVLFGDIKQSIGSVYKKYFQDTDNISVQLDTKTGEISIFGKKKICEEVENGKFEISLDDARELDPAAQAGDEISVDITPADFGRIAIQTAKQVIMQKIREAEKKVVYDEYRRRVGDVITGIISRVNNNNVFVNLGKTEGVLPYREQIPGEHYIVGERVKTYVLDVRKTPKGPYILLSRTYPNLIKRLMELEVPEIYRGLVEIKSVAREPGNRAKIAITSKEKRIDSVGACVGMKGTRIQSIVRELNGEKIDIVEWSENVGEFVKNALNPAKVVEVYVDQETKKATVIVPDNQISLAIGKEGQNARLSAKLTGYKIDIKSETSYNDDYNKKKVEQAAKELFAKSPKKSEKKGLANIKDLTKNLRDRLTGAGCKTIDDLKKMTLEKLTEIEGIGEKTAEKIMKIAEAYGKK